MNNKLIEEIARLRVTLDEIARASWPSVSGDDPVKRIQAFAKTALNNESKPVENGRVATD